MLQKNNLSSHKENFKMVNFLRRNLRKGSTQVVLKKIVIYILMFSLGILFALPFIWLISTSLKVPRQIFVFPPVWIPSPLTWQSYLDILPLMHFFRSLKNSLTVVCGVVVGVLFSCPLVAYSFARLDWPGRNFFFILLLSTMMIPFAVTLIPIFIIFNILGWVNTFKPLIVPAFMGRNPFFIFLLRQFFLTIPTDLSDAARIDGCSEFRIYWNIILPLTKPILTVVAIFSFMYSWNDFLRPLIYLNSQEKWTMALSLYAVKSGGASEISWGPLMAGSVLMCIPMVIIFFLAQKQFIEGVTLTGIKG